MEGISKPVVRIDAGDKTGGYAKYFSDLELNDALYAKTLHSQKAKAKILAVNYPKLPEGYYIIDKNDVLGPNAVKIITNDEPVFAGDTVNYIGEPILLVAGPKKEKVIEILSKIKIEYEELVPVLSIDEAKESFCDYKYTKGDIEGIKDKAEYIYEWEFETGYQEHLYLEPNSIAAKYDNGRIIIIGSMQCPYYVRDAAAMAVNLPPEKVQVIQAVTGGGFGGKEDYPSVIGCQAAVAAMKTKKTVKIVYDRQEDIKYTTKRHPSRSKLKAYIDKDYKIIGMTADVKLDSGPYETLSQNVLQMCIFMACGAYNVENVCVNGSAPKTNNIVTSAYRGFGGPQIFSAVETFIEYIAEKLNISPSKFRSINYLKTGDHSSTNGTFREKLVIKELSDSVLKASDYERKLSTFKNNKDGKLHGIGMSVFCLGAGFSGFVEVMINTTVRLKKYKDNKVEILVSTVEMGQGAATTLSKIVARALDIPFENVICKNPDTDKVPNSGPSVASRTILIVGRLLEKAAYKLKESFKDGCEQIVDVTYTLPKDMEWNEDKFEGDAFCAYSWGANVIEVEIDPVTYETSVKGIWTAYDIGNAIDERIAFGQIQGSVVQGLGYASMEVLDSKNGELIQTNLTDYIVPTAMDFPKIEIKLINSPYNNGPFGAKGLGELALNGSPPAYAAAVQNAINRKINKIPVTPEYIREVMKNEAAI